MNHARAAFEADLKAKIAGTVLEPHFDKVLEQVKVHINIQLERVEINDIPYGASRLAGVPDLPLDFEWPEYQARPLNFIGQFNLEQVAPYDTFEQLPQTGMLSFFFGELGTAPEDPDAWRVYLHPLEDLVRYEPPLGVYEEAYPCIVSFNTTYVVCLEPPFDNITEENEYDAVYELQGRYQEPGSTCLLGTSLELSIMGLDDVIFILSHMAETDQIKWCGAIIFGLATEDLKAHRFEKVWIETTSD